MSNGRVADRVFWLAVPVGLIVLLAFAHDATFRIDDWELAARRSFSDPVGLLRPYNDEWITTPTVLFRAVFSVAGLRSYLPYLGLTLLAHALAAERLRRLVNHLSGPTVGLAAGIVFLFLGSAGEVLNQAIGLGVVLPVGLGIWALDLVYTARQTDRAAVLLGLAVSSHPIGVVFVGACLLVAPRTPRKLFPLFLVIALFVAWTLVFELQNLGSHGGSLGPSLLVAPLFVFAGTLAALGSVFGLGTLPGVVVVFVLALGATTIARHPASPSVVVATAAGIAIEFVLIAVSRGEFGPTVATSSRYMYAAVAFVMIGTAAWFGPVADRTLASRRNVLAVAALVGVAVVGNLSWYASYREVAATAMEETRAAIAIALWRTDMVEWNQNLFLPSPVELRELIAEHGDPLRGWSPWAVPPVPESVVRSVCASLAPFEATDACVVAVKSRTGGEQDP